MESLTPAAPGPPLRQSGRWLELLGQLTSEVPDWFAMKGVESALTGTGDVDSVAPRSSWPVIQDIFAGWAAAQGLGPVVICPHAPYLIHLVAVSDLRPEVFELDVNARKIFFGSTLFRPEDVAPLAVRDERGFRRLRPGVEGVLKLVQNASRRDGRCIPEALEAKSVAARLKEDPEGVVLFSRRFGWAGPSVVRAAKAVEAGGWDRRAMLEVRLACLLRSPAEPDAAVARVRFKWQRRHCPVLQMVLRDGRRVENREEWLLEVSRSHEVR